METILHINHFNQKETPKMKKCCRFLTLLLAVGLLLLGSAVFADANKPVKVIFDTDIGNDVDDTLALAMLHTLQDRGDCEILAVTLTKDNSYAEAFTKLLNEFYGRPSIPIGYADSKVTPAPGKYVQKVFELKDANGQPRFKLPDVKKGNVYMSAVKLLRKTLAAQKDGDVVIIQIGFSTNLARLLDTPGDEFSPLTGRELLAKKVQYLSIMAGAFIPRLAKHKEYNIQQDIKSAQKLFTNCPIPIICNGFELGEAIQMPGIRVAEDYNYVPNHPVKEAYSLYRDGWGKNQATFDLLSVLYAVRPSDWYFTLSKPGTIKVNDDATTVFTPNENGKHRVISVTEVQKARILEAFIWLCSDRPNAGK